MTAAFKFFLLKSARLCEFRNLAFLVIFILGCNAKEETAIRVVWIDNKAAAVYLPRNLLADVASDSISSFIKVCQRLDKNQTAILGELQVRTNIIFEPLLPFSRGSDYDVLYKNKKIGEFSIPAADTKNFPELLTFYPKQDTVPENLLKIYLSFSHPMSEGHSDKYIKIIKNRTDTLKDEFLNLQPELWNEDRTVITIWFDPGRIKRDLQPNLRLGAPLEASEKYEVIISHEWKDAEGIPLQKDFVKHFITGNRDSLSPDINFWKLLPPLGNSVDPLVINQGEALDHYLFAECLKVKDDHGNIIKGKFEVDDLDRSCRFIPVSKWLPGSYSLVIESRLEDLAGNNLNRPFDRDITKTKEPVLRGYYEIKFSINSRP